MLYPPVGIELVGIFVGVGIQGDSPVISDDCGILGNVVSHVLIILDNGMRNAAGDYRSPSVNLFHDCVYVRKPADVIKGWKPFPADDSINLLLNLPHLGRMQNG